MSANTSLDENILVALVLVLSHQLDQTARDRGTQRVGGDYTQEAVRLIQERKLGILGLFGIRSF